MKKTLAIFVQEYLMKVRTRGFLIGTLLFPIFVVGISVVPALFMSMDVSKSTSLVVVDRSGELYTPFEEALADTGAAEVRNYTLLLEPALGRSEEEVVRTLGERVDEGLIDGFIVLPEDVVSGGRPSFYAENVSDFRRNERIQSALEDAVREVRVRHSQLDPDQVSTILRPVSLSTYRVGEGGAARRDEGLTFAIAYAVGFVFYIALLIYGAMMLRTTLEEKTSRSAESMVATVRPTQLMGGKILGIGAVGLTQMAIWTLVAVLAGTYGGGLLAGEIPELDLSQTGVGIGSVLLFLLYFILGFFFYAALYGAIGAMVSSEADAQQLQFPITMPIILALLLMFLAIRDPAGTVVRVCSWLPFFAPILMPVRLIVLRPPAWEILGSIVFLGLSIWGAVWVSARIFRVGLLMYGKRPNLPELVKWIRYG